MMIFQILLKVFMSSVSFGANCPPGEHWVRPHNRSAYTRLDGVSVSATYVVGHCQSNPSSFGIWGNAFKSGLPPNWPNKSEKAKPWKEDEKERVLELLAKLPEPFSNMPNVKLYRLSKSETKGNPGTSTDNEIALYDEAFTSDQLSERVLLHELAHEEYRRHNEFDQTVRNSATGWSKNTDDKWIFTNRKTVADDSSSSPEEAYANAIEYYFIEPTRLKFKDPVLYDWISTNYKGKIKK